VSALLGITFDLYLCNIYEQQALEGAHKGGSTQHERAEAAREGRSSNA